MDVVVALVEDALVVVDDVVVIVILPIRIIIILCGKGVFPTTRVFFPTFCRRVWNPTSWVFFPTIGWKNTRLETIPVGLPLYGACTPGEELRWGNGEERR